MTEPDVDDDAELVERIRVTLRAVASATPLHPGVASPPPRRVRRLVPAVAAVLVGIVGVAVVTARGHDPVEVRVGAPASTPRAGSGLPAGFDLATATPVFSADGDVDDVGLAYLRSRFPDFPAPGVQAERAEVAGARAVMAWTTGSGHEGTIASGQLHLRREGDRWTVVAAMTEGVDLSEVSYDGARLRGTVRSTHDDSLFADVLDWSGAPVHRSPRPKGQPGAGYRFGTAGGPADGRLDLDIEHPGAPAVLRVHLVGGTLLSVSELRFDPAPVARHVDLEGCVEQRTNTAKEPTPNVVYRSCAAALDGVVIGRGTAGDRSWEAVASDEPTGHWVTLRSRDQIGTFRLQHDGGFSGDAERTPFVSLGPCCAIGEHVAVVGAFHPDVVALRLRLPSGAVVEAPTFADGARQVRYAVVTVPIAETGTGEAPAEVQLEDGRWHPLDVPVGLAVLGG